MSENQNGLMTLPRTTVRDSACDVLRRMIVGGGLPAGHPLHQVSLATQLGISRTPLREALHTLSAEGLVSFDANGTAFVVEPSAEELREIYSIREVLEILAGREAAEHISEAQIIRAETVLDGMEDVADPVEWASLNARFHRLIYEAARKPQLLELIEILRNRAKLYVTLLAADVKNASHAAEEHRAMLEALRSRDADGMERLIRMHLSATAMKVGAHLEAATDSSDQGLTRRPRQGAS